IVGAHPWKKPPSLLATRTAPRCRNMAARSMGLLLAVSCGTIRTDDHLLDDFLSCAARIIGVILLSFAIVVCANKCVGPGTIRVLLSAALNEEMLRRGSRRNHALTQLTPEHESEPMAPLPGWLMSRKD